MVLLYNLGSRFLGLLSDLYNFIFAVPLEDSVIFKGNWALKTTINTVISLLPDLGISLDMTVAEFVIGAGLIGLVAFRILKFFVGIVTGS